MGLLGAWLRAHALRPGLDLDGCDADDLAAVNTAMREMLPKVYAEKVVAADERMANAVRALCEQTSGGAVVVVVGAQHVDGISRRLRE